MQVRFLEDELIRLRAVEPSDAEAMWLVECDSTQWRENGMCAPYSKRNLLDYATTYDADPLRAGQLRLVAETSSDGAIAGLADLYDISVAGRTAFIGIYVLPALRGNGFAARMLALLEDYALNILNLRILAAKVSDSNMASRRLFEEAGYRKCGELSDWILNGRDTRSLVIYSKPILT